LKYYIILTDRGEVLEKILWENNTDKNNIQIVIDDKGIRSTKWIKIKIFLREKEINRKDLNSITCSNIIKMIENIV
jgi:uncharacterized protein (UPF0248 family)